MKILICKYSYYYLFPSLLAALVTPSYAFLEKNMQLITPITKNTIVPTKIPVFIIKIQKFIFIFRNFIFM